MKSSTEIKKLKWKITSRLLGSVIIEAYCPFEAMALFFENLKLDAANITLLVSDGFTLVESTNNKTTFNTNHYYYPKITSWVVTLNQAEKEKEPNFN